MSLCSILNHKAISKALLILCVLAGLLSLSASLIVYAKPNELAQLAEFIGGLFLLMLSTITVPTKLYRGLLSYLNLLCALFLCLLLSAVLLYMRTIPLQSTSVAKVGILVFGIGLISFIAFRGGPLRNAILTGAWIFCLAAGQISFNILLLPHYPVQEFRQPIPYLMFAGQPNTGDLNALGYLGSVPALPKKDEFRVLVLGNSTLYISTIVPTLQKLARTNGFPKATFYNWSVPSQVSGMEVSTIFHRGLNYQPDLIVLYDGQLDFGAPVYYDPRPGYPFNFIVYERGMNLLQGEDIGSTLLLLAANSHLVRSMFNQEIEADLIPLQPLRDAVSFGSSAWFDKTVDIYLDNLDHACQLAESGAFQFVAILQPSAYTKIHLTPQEEQGVPSDDYGPDFRADWERARLGFETLMLKHGAKRDCLFIDLSRMYDSYPNPDTAMFWDVAHVTPEGSDYAAQQIFNVLKPIMHNSQ